MTYFADLSTYTYREAPDRSLPTLNVGWLDGEHEYPTRAPDEGLVEALWGLCAVLVVPLRGFHACEVCGTTDHGPLSATRTGVTRKLGFAEIRVFDEVRSVVYAAPNMVFHYVTRHHYDPPAAFKEAALQMLPASNGYMDRLRALGLRFWDERSVSDRPGPALPTGRSRASDGAGR